MQAWNWIATLTCSTSDFPVLIQVTFSAYVSASYTAHTAFLKGFKKSGLRRTKHIILGYIRPVEFNGGTLEILSLTLDILILASFEGVQSSTRRKHVRIKSFQTPYKHALRMTFLLQTQKLIMSNAWNLTKFIRGHDSEYRTPAALYVESCYCFEKKMKS